MRKKMWLASMLAAFLLTAGTVQAQSVSDKISALEQELQQLKEQQIELKKEATAAAAAMPSFSYRPGNGVEIEAADKAWGLRFTDETHFRYNFEAGRDQQGRTNGQLMGRRFRPGFFTASTTACGKSRRLSTSTAGARVTARTTKPPA